MCNRLGCRSNTRIGNNRKLGRSHTAPPLITNNGSMAQAYCQQMCKSEQLLSWSLVYEYLCRELGIGSELKWDLLENRSVRSTQRVGLIAMSAKSLARPSHCIAVLMAPDGRFLECQTCRLRIQFAAGTHYDVVVIQFDSHLCGSSSSSIPRVVLGNSVQRCGEEKVEPHH